MTPATVSPTGDQVLDRLFLHVGGIPEPNMPESLIKGKHGVCDSRALPVAETAPIDLPCGSQARWK